MLACECRSVAPFWVFSLDTVIAVIIVVIRDRRQAIDSNRDCRSSLTRFVHALRGLASMNTGGESPVEHLLFEI